MMRKISKILCLVGGFLGIALAVLWLALGILFAVYGGFSAAVAAGQSVPSNVLNWLSDWWYEHYSTPIDWEALAGALFGMAALYFIMMLFSIASSVLSFILRGKDKTGLPLPIVLAVVSWSANLAALGGAVLAIVNWAIVERKEGNSEEPKAE